MFGRKLLAVPLTLVLSLGMWGCGDGGTTAQNENDAVADIQIDSDDQMNFSIDRFTVRAGQEVRLTLTHTGSMSVEAMGHNVVIIQAGEDPIAFGDEAIRSGADLDNQYVPQAVRDRVIAFTRMIGGGESDTITFTAPSSPGEYPFICSFPGHYAIMRGVMVVE